MVETDKPEEEIKPALDLIGPVLEKFVTVSDVFEPIDKSILIIFISLAHLFHFRISNMILMKLLNFMRS